MRTPVLLLVILARCGGGGVPFVPPPDAPEDVLLPELAGEPDTMPDGSADLAADRQGGDLLDVVPEDLVPDIVEDLLSDAPTPPCTVDSDCDDGDPCTLDRCVETSCFHDLLPPGFCCSEDGDCDDGVPCTLDQCLYAACWNLPGDSSCCTLGTDCEDFNPCTVDLCIGSTCGHVFASDGAACQCQDVLDCDDGLPCTVQSCAGGVCQYAPAAGVTGCCDLAADCDDGDPGTEDTCLQNTCGNLPWDLCLVDAHCDDGDGCTTDLCQDGICAHMVPDGCCQVAAQCADGLGLTTDLCMEGACVHATSSPPAPCGSAGDCPAPETCLQAHCVAGLCSVTPMAELPGCCLSDGDCDDGDPCTQDSCAAPNCLHVPLSGPVPQVLWSFGSPSLPGFSVTGGVGGVGWTTSFAMFTSPPRSLYFGDPAAGSFQAGSAVVSGEVRGPLVQLPPTGPVALQGTTYIDVEPLFSRDLVWIAVEIGGLDSVVWTKEDVGGTTAQAWLPFQADLSSFAGQALRVVFGFDSVDGLENSGEGVFFDDVALVWACGT